MSIGCSTMLSAILNGAFRKLSTKLYVFCHGYPWLLLTSSVVLLKRNSWISCLKRTSQVSKIFRGLISVPVVHGKPRSSIWRHLQNSQSGLVNFLKLSNISRFTRLKDFPNHHFNAVSPRVIFGTFNLITCLFLLVTLNIDDPLSEFGWRSW